MKRRDFIAGTAGFLSLSTLGWTPSAKAAAPAIAEKDILRDGMPATIANYCEQPEKQPNKLCPGFKDKPGKCSTCLFYNKDNSKTTFKGKEYARCQLLADPSKPQFVLASAWCATYTKQS